MALRARRRHNDVPAPGGFRSPRTPSAEIPRAGTGRNPIAPVYSPAKLRGQFIQAAITLILAALAFAAVVSKRKTVYEVDDSGLSGTGFGDETIPWESVGSVDWSRWDEKGIVTVILKDGRRFKLDGWHFAGMRPVAEVLAERFARG